MKMRCGLSHSTVLSCGKTYQEEAPMIYFQKRERERERDGDRDKEIRKFYLDIFYSLFS
jgi:hypothetical protein